MRAFWQRVRQGLTILRDREAYKRKMVPWQFASWIARFAAYWALLDAFHIGGSVSNALLVLAVQVVASVFPFTPGGAGVQQALLIAIFKSSDAASFSVGQQIATAVLSSALGFAALVLIFRFKSFREVVAARESIAATAPGMLATAMPCLVAASTSMVFTPAPNLCTSRARVARARSGLRQRPQHMPDHVGLG